MLIAKQFAEQIPTKELESRRIRMLGTRFLKNPCIHFECHPSPQMNAAVVAA
jgi:hypothetical protein